MHLSRGALSQSPNRVIVHAMSEYLLHEGKWIHASEFLEKIGLSAHALVTPHNGVMLCRNFNEGAYHAKGFTKDSLGIEFLIEGNHTYSAFLKAMKKPYLTESQYENGVRFVFVYSLSNCPLLSMNIRRFLFSPALKYPIARCTLLLRAIFLNRPSHFSRSY